MALLNQGPMWPRRLSSLLAVCVVCTVPAFASAAAPSPELMARCSLLYEVWRKYLQDPAFYHTGDRAQAEFALYRCQRGEYDAHIATLETLLRNGRFTTETLGRNPGPSHALLWER
jgi:hypothetical protein